MKSIFYLLLAALLTFACSSEKNASVPIGEWQEIFNGKDLSGWETMGKLETQIKDGELHIYATHPNNNAWVLTTKSYQNFKLECEFLMPDTTANSGVLIRFDPEEEGIPNATAYEANIDWRTNIKNPMGTLENAARAKLLENPDKSSWHKMSIEANGDYLKAAVDGEVVCETHNRRRLEGKIGLQVPINQGDEIAFRNIRIQELREISFVEELLEDQYRNSERPMQAMLRPGSLEGWHTSGPGTWTFEEDVLHAYSGETPSFLITDQAYRNFYLKCQFKIIKEDNSGIFIRQHPDSANVSTQNAIECNIYDHNGPAHAYSTGSIVSYARAWPKMIDYKDWNEMEIFAQDEHIVLYINGQKSSEAYLPESFSRAGNICLQAGTKVFTDNSPSDIYFKDLMIREMDE